MDDPTDFPSDYGPLRDLDAAMRCPICKELYSDFSPLTLSSCFHTGCSYCIRKAVQDSNICPLCREPADETKIRVNRDLERVVTEWRTRSRDVVLQLVQVATQPKPEPLAAPAPAPSSVIAPSRQAPPPNTGTADEPIVIDDGPVSDTASCPICNQVVRIQFMNKHIDKNCCPDPFLAKTANGSGDMTSFFAPAQGAKPKAKSTANKATDERTRLPPLVYDIMNDKKLREQCKKHGLADSGTRAQLTRRLSEFILRYNANLDSENPKTTKKVVDEVVRWERQLDNSRPAALSLLGKEKADPTKFDSKAYVAANSQQFAQLIERARPKKSGSESGKKTSEDSAGEVIAVDEEEEQPNGADDDGDSDSRTSGEENRAEPRQPFFGQTVPTKNANTGDTEENDVHQPAKRIRSS